MGTNAQTLPNGDFEDMHINNTQDANGDPVSYDSLGMGWVSGNEIWKDIALGDIPPFMKDTSWTNSGNHAILLRTQTLTGIVATGNAGLGTYEYDPENPFNSVKVGVPYTERPDSLTGFYDYLSVMGDSCKVGVFFSKWNATTMQRDTIGLGEFSTNQSTGGNYTRFSVPITYTSTDMPDTMGIITLSSKGGFGGGTPVGQNGSTLILDDLAFATNDASVIENQLDNIAVFSNENSISINSSIDCSVNIFTLSGKLLHSSDVKIGNSQIDLGRTRQMLIVRFNQGGNSVSKKVIH